MFGASHMSAAERQGVEDQQRRDMQARGVRPVRPEVLAAMIDDLGDVRINDLPLEDRPRNAPVAVCHGHRAAQDRAPMLASRNHWTAAIASGKFQDADAEAVKGLDPLGRPRSVVVQELATQALDHNAVGALEQPQDYTHRAPTATRAPRHIGQAHGRRREIPPWVPVPRTSTLGIVLQDNHTPVRNFNGQNRIANTQLSMTSNPTAEASQPRRMHAHWAGGIPSNPRVVASNVQPITTAAQNVARSAAQPVATAEARSATTQPQTQTQLPSLVAVEAPVIVEAQPTVQPQHASSTVFQVPELSDIYLTAVVHYLDRSTQPAKIGKAKVHLAKARGSATGSFYIRFAVSLSHLQPASYQVNNIRLPEPTDLENHRVTLACKKEFAGSEDLHLMQFDDAETLAKFMTTFNLLRGVPSVQPTLADPVSIDSVPAGPVPAEPTSNAQVASTNGTTETSEAPTTQATELADIHSLAVHPEASTTFREAESEVSTPAKQTPNVQVTTGSASTPVAALPTVLVSHNTPSPGRHRSPPDLVSLESSPGSDSPTQSATQDLAGLQPWYTHEAAAQTATGEVGRLADDLSTLTISSPAVRQAPESQALLQDDTGPQVVENTATLAEQEEPEVTVIEAGTQNTVDDKTAMRNALHRLEDTLMDLFHLEDGGLPGDMAGIQQTIKGIKQAVATRVRPLLKEARYFGGLTEDEKTQVLEEFIGEHLPADDVTNSEAVSRDPPSPSGTTASNPPSDDSTTAPRIEYTFDEIHALYRDDYPAPRKLFELEISPMILNSAKRATAATGVAIPTAAASMTTDETGSPAVTAAVNEPAEDATLGDNDTTDDSVVEEVPVEEAKEEEKPKNTVKSTSGTARDLADRFRSFKINTPAGGTNSNLVGAVPVQNSIPEAMVRLEEPAIASDQVNGNKTDMSAIDHKDKTNALEEASNDTMNEAADSDELGNGDTTGGGSVPAALDPAAAHFAPVVTPYDESPTAPVLAPITLANPRSDMMRGLGNSRWASASSVRITNKGCFTGVTPRTDRV